uniref:Fibronectin type-III domain-containing protein n=1 Tax=Callorhinchus milii TaxID=7868 RepID=A0A4W3JQ63_CALMI
MGIAVQNISSTSAIVKWPSAVHCADDFYSIMYHPNWNTLLSSYSRKTFQKEQRVPISQNWLTIENLTPLTTYILCVTCQPANPSNDQCTIFNTMSQETAAVRSKKKDLAMGIWLTSSVLLLIIAGTLLYGCIHVWCRKRQEQAEGFSISSDQERTQQCPTNSGGLSDQIIFFNNNYSQLISPNSILHMSNSWFKECTKSAYDALLGV